MPDSIESTPIPFTPLRRHLDGALHIPRLELRGAEIAQSRVDSDPVVEKPMYSKISSAACSRVSKVLACTHSALMRPMSDSIAALSHGEDIDPIEGSMPASRIILPSSSETYCEP